MAPLENKASRNAEIEALHCQGATYASLGRQFSLSSGRVVQIIANVRRMRRKIEAGLNAPLRHVT